MLPVNKEEDHKVGDAKQEVNKRQCHDTDDNSKVITDDEEDSLFNKNEIYLRIYFCGIEASIRSQV